MIAMILGLFIACGDKITDTADDSVENPYTNNPATFTEVNDELLMKSCAFSSCHAVAAGYLLLEEEGNYTRLVDIASFTLTDEILVVPNDADSSYLFKKVIGAEGIAGDIMAPNGAGISLLQEQMLRSWIEDGAQNN